MCWILHNNYGINTVLHLLDDFLTIDRPSANADATMKILVSVFASLEIPIAKHKTLGPVTCIEYLGIILDTIRMEARLPEDKLCRIKEYLLFFLNRKTCTKREMLSLLGHLNFAMRVIIPGRSFISYLLNIAHSVKELHHHVTLNSSCRNDLSLWHKFLDQWNGISFFIDDDIVNASDFDLYTDSASTVGFGGYFKNRWFQALWPVEMKLDTELSLSMAYMELYLIVIAAIIWGDEWSGKRILFYCDNMATDGIVIFSMAVMRPKICPLYAHILDETAIFFRDQKSCHYMHILDETAIFLKAAPLRTETSHTNAQNLGGIAIFSIVAVRTKTSQVHAQRMEGIEIFSIVAVRTKTSRLHVQNLDGIMIFFRRCENRNKSLKSTKSGWDSDILQSL
ncbi:Hypothetical predicted protein [Mytilus galloprovincialis]|uniref:Reverse transcriptase domain-containing protein n=1 Tax=Mytilus galloprovincialis TaxID=29158 RepID=A0A8B6G8P3_MYTGA|nr:Hypothetical predicted protein [Mytilus galloprovincialis]